MAFPALKLYYSFIFNMDYLQTGILFFTLWITSNGQIRLIRILNGTEIYIREHSETHIQCRVIGTNHTLQWSKRNDNGSFIKLPDPINPSKLFFSNFSANDVGSYQCQAKDEGFGAEWVNSTDSHVYLVPFDHVLNVKILNSSLVTIGLNYNCSLLCKSDTNNSEYRWGKKSLFGFRIVHENTSQLIFHRVTEKDNGRYVCQAKAKDQTSWATSAEVKVVVVSNKTKYVEIVNGSHVTIREHSIHTYLLCYADGFQMEFRWLKVDFWGHRYPIQNSNRNHYDLIDTSPSDEETYICQSRSLGQEKWVSSQSIYVKIISGEPLVRIFNDSLVFIPVGSKSAFLQCQSSISSLEYRWMKRTWSGNAVLPNSNHHHLHLPMITREVAGHYTCQVSVLTPFGNSTWIESSSIEVQVAGLSSESSQKKSKFILILTLMLLKEILNLQIE